MELEDGTTMESIQVSIRGFCARGTILGDEGRDSCWKKMKNYINKQIFFWFVVLRNAVK